tara:strand:- start:2047 stop:2310 length:264 start_codon:yes stop_codon:yes gene_type:complete
MLDDIHSLKAKRNTIRPIIEKVKSRHNVSISEISLQDDFKVSILGITYVSNSSTNNLKIINKVLDFINSLSDGFAIIDTEIETITGF